MSTTGRSVVITGAGSGVGRASALRFAAAGDQIICADIMDGWAAETVRLVEKAGGIDALKQMEDSLLDGGDLPG